MERRRGGGGGRPGGGRVQDAPPGPRRPRVEPADALPVEGEAVVAVRGRRRDRRLGVVRLVICNDIGVENALGSWCNNSSNCTYKCATTYRSLTQKRVFSRGLCRPLRDLRGVPPTDLQPRPRGSGRRGQRLGTAVAAPEDEALRDVAGAHQVNHRVGYYGKARPTLEPRGKVVQLTLGREDTCLSPP